MCFKPVFLHGWKKRKTSIQWYPGFLSQVFKGMFIPITSLCSNQKVRNLFWRAFNLLNPGAKLNRIRTDIKRFISKMEFCLKVLMRDTGGWCSKKNIRLIWVPYFFFFGFFKPEPWLVLGNNALSGINRQSIITLYVPVQELKATLYIP